MTPEDLNGNILDCVQERGGKLMGGNINKHFFQIKKLKQKAFNNDSTFSVDLIPNPKNLHTYLLFLYMVINIISK